MDHNEILFAISVKVAAPQAIRATRGRIQCGRCERSGRRGALVQKDSYLRGRVSVVNKGGDIEVPIAI